jgi:YgiT-type zinc finger domain-containing protein
MKCFLCKGDMNSSTTTYMTTHNNCYIIIKNVPCLKCDQCGEEYIDGSTLMKIESIIEKLKSALTEIAVVDFLKAA